MSEKQQDLKPRTKVFALWIIRTHSKLRKNDTVAQVFGKQVLRSGTSIGANYDELSRGQSKAECWLELLVDSGCVPAAHMADLLDETRQPIAFSQRLIRMLKAKVFEKIPHTIQVSAFSPVSAFSI